MLVFAAGPQREPDARLGLVLRVVGEREALAEHVYQDGPFAGAGGEIAVRRDRHADADRPPLAGPHGVEEAVDVERHPGRRLARQHDLEMPPRERVLLLEEERAGQLQAHPHQLRPGHQHRAELGDRLVEQFVPLVGRRGARGLLHRLHAGEEAGGGVIGRGVGGPEQEHREGRAQGDERDEAAGHAMPAAASRRRRQFIMSFFPWGGAGTGRSRGTPPRSLGRRGRPAADYCVFFAPKVPVMRPIFVYHAR